MQKIFIVFMLLLGADLNAQQNLQKYYQYVYDAEENILQDSFDLALNNYEQAFLFHPRPFYKDIYNASVCCMKIGNFEKGKKYMLAQVQFGLELNYFYYQKAYYDFFESDYWDEFLEEYRKERQKYLEQIDPDLLADADYLLAKDQRLRTIDPNYTTLYDSIYKSDEENTKLILDIIDKKGFPNEYNLGFKKNCDSVYESSLKFIVPILHVYNKFENKDPNIHFQTHSFDFTQILLKELDKGNLQVDWFAYLNDRSGAYKLDHGFGQDGVVTIINQKVYYPRLQDLCKTNLFRARYNLCTIEHLRKKIISSQITRQYHIFEFIDICSGLSVYNMDLPKDVLDSMFEETEFTFTK